MLHCSHSQTAVDSPLVHRELSIGNLQKHVTVNSRNSCFSNCLCCESLKGVIYPVSKRLQAFLMCWKSCVAQKHGKHALPSNMKNCRREWKYWYLEKKSCIFNSVQLTGTAITISVRNKEYLEAVCMAEFINTQQLYQCIRWVSILANWETGEIIPLLFKTQKWFYEFEIEISELRKCISLKKIELCILLFDVS